jgi:hypothetical protein
MQARSCLKSKRLPSEIVGLLPGPLKLHLGRSDELQGFENGENVIDRNP